ncbi:N-methyl-L-tryptophan oxidase [Prauserella sp. PE36]|uniref:N-methyl-L-tryptophan oxidase n=1 Tax=Prauserella endophytica TaxID=1592324 RepID=A0ABY2S8V0_9PSEU|nr:MULTISPECIES: N-methyl-L-tryptophan oxidase [Prauserella]RBM21108.1 N-methyl-L-tryptophan oxidase [Prauserella sp. PE36]TKG72108.1 N-methyl-L-tryptophan oxidase [Prauserella endophytica]
MSDRASGVDADVVVVGVGTMGSMALWRLARDGLRVIGLEQHAELGHEHGAAGGRTRIFRVAYKEGAWYVPLLRRAASAWAELAEATGERIMLPTGALSIGAPEHPDVAEVLRSGEEFGLPHERLDHDQLAARYPQHVLRDDDVGVLDPQGGLLFPSTAIRAAAGLARDLGGDVRTGVRCTGIDEAGGHVRVHTTGGVLTASRVLVCGGPWTAELLAGVRGRYEVRRVVLHWFRATDPAAFAPERFPVGIRRSGPEAELSFFPPDGDGLVKVNLHIPKETVPDLSTFDRAVPAGYTRRVETAIGGLFTGLEPSAEGAAAFIEGYTPDNHGLIGTPPGFERVVSMSGFSGHGFKLSPVLASLAVDALLGLGDEPLPARLDLARTFQETA